MKFKILFLGVLLSIGHSMIGFSSFQQVIMLFAGVFLVGIPHGSMDHYLYIENYKLSGSVENFIKFIIQYIAVGLIYALLWWLNPVLALAIFIGISAYHFGELDTLHFDFRTKKYAFIVAFSYGLFFLLNLLFLHSREVLPIITSFPGISISTPKILHTLDSLFPLFPILSAIIFSLMLFISLKKAAYFSRNTIINLLILVILQVVVFSMPLILGFAFYFCAWHSVLSFKIIVNHLSWETNSPIVVLKKLIPTNLAAWLFLGVLMYYFKSDVNTLIAILFLGIAILTAPHIGVISKMLHFYKIKN